MSATATNPPSPQTLNPLIDEIVERHSDVLLKVARRYSYCMDDAHDAYQRSIEILIERVDSLRPVTALAWLRTVIKHEALAIRAARGRILSSSELELDLLAGRISPGVEERVVGFEAARHSAEALTRLKPHERRALTLKADGYSYRQISALTGWTYTKVNRCITEGRRNLRHHCAAVGLGHRSIPLLGGLHARALLSVQKLHLLVEGASTAKLAVVAASVAAVAGGSSAVVERAAHSPRPVIERSAVPAAALQPVPHVAIPAQQSAAKLVVDRSTHAKPDRSQTTRSGHEFAL